VRHNPLVIAIGASSGIQHLTARKEDIVVGFEVRPSVAVMKVYESKNASHGACLNKLV
jgi:hypothetical protein